MRLFYGFDPSLTEALTAIVDDGEVPAVLNALNDLRVDPVHPGMPFAEAIKLAKFLADTTVGFAHFVPGPDFVGGEVEIAAISRHEGFKWVNRKHYYSPDLNPKDPNHVV